MMHRLALIITQRAKKGTKRAFEYSLSIPQHHEAITRLDRSTRITQIRRTKQVKKPLHRSIHQFERRPMPRCVTVAPATAICSAPSVIHVIDPLCLCRANTTSTDRPAYAKSSVARRSQVYICALRVPATDKAHHASRVDRLHHEFRPIFLEVLK
jgi:hypothetical protein